MKLFVASAALLLCLASTSPAHALASLGDEVLSAAVLAEMETRADHAAPREQCILFTELVHDYVEVAGKQLAAGDMDQATESLKHIQTIADRIHQGLGKDSKRVKNAEMIVHLAAYHLSQLMHVIATEDSAILQATLKQLNKLHDELLAQVFAH